MHDAAALDASGLLDGIDPSGWIADKGYIGRGMITPHKKPPNGELSETAKEENKSVNKIRQVVERTIAHIKAWRILHTDYRRPLTHSSRPSPPHSHSIFLQNHPLNNLPGRRDVHFALESAVPTVILECKVHPSNAKCTSRRGRGRSAGRLA